MDETGDHLKKGTSTERVQRQYTGTDGRASGAPRSPSTLPTVKFPFASTAESGKPGNIRTEIAHIQQSDGTRNIYSTTLHGAPTGTEPCIRGHVPHVNESVGQQVPGPFAGARGSGQGCY